MFECIDNKYKRWHFALVDKRVLSPCMDHYTESHHVQPRSLGGSNSPGNLVQLSVREHIVCHRLLIKFVQHPLAKQKMLLALHFLCHGKYKLDERKTIMNKFSSRLLAELRKNLHTPKSIETRKRMSVARTGTKRKYEHYMKVNTDPEKIRKTAEFHRGRKRSAQTKNKQSVQKKEFLSSNDPFNKGKKQYYDPGNSLNTGVYRPGSEPAGWILGNQRARGVKTCYSLVTGEVKRFTCDMIPDGWFVGHPNNKGYEMYINVHSNQHKRIKPNTTPLDDEWVHWTKFNEVQHAQ